MSHKFNYIKEYKLFENQTNEILEIYDILYEFLEEYDYTVPDVKDTSKSISGYGDYGSILIEESYHFGAKCIQIRITSNSNNRSIKQGTFKNFDGIVNSTYSKHLQECHKRITQLLQPIEVIVGSLGVYTIDLDLLYFYEKPDFSRYKGVEIYGSNISIYLDKIEMYLMSNSRHNNSFSVFKNIQGNSFHNFQILGMFYLMCYYDGYMYQDKDNICQNDNTNQSITSNTTIVLKNWIKSEWGKICQKLKIKHFQKVNPNPKITVAEFLVKLKENQGEITHQLN